MILAAVAMLGACAAPPRLGGRKVYAQDSISAHCPHNPALCAVTAKGVTDGLPPAVGAAGAVLAASQGTAAATAGKGEPLDVATQKRVEQALKECADLARSEVLTRRFPRGGPTQEDCDQLIDRGLRTRAMQLGEEMHRAAFECVEEKLGQLLPGQFSIEQRYRYDPKTTTTTVVSAAEARRGTDLRGTIAPDVVIHAGDPRFPQAVYDFKFPCANSDRLPQWREYPRDHPFSPRDQGQVYSEALGQEPAMVVPRLGVIRL